MAYPRIRLAPAETVSGVTQYYYNMRDAPHLVDGSSGDTATGYLNTTAVSGANAATWVMLDLGPSPTQILAHFTTKILVGGPGSPSGHGFLDYGWTNTLSSTITFNGQVPSTNQNFAANTAFAWDPGAFVSPGGAFRYILFAVSITPTISGAPPPDHFWTDLRCLDASGNPLVLYDWPRPLDVVALG